MLRNVFRCMLIILVITTFAILPAAENEIKTLSIGSKALNFKLDGIDGKEYALNSF